MQARFHISVWDVENWGCELILGPVLQIAGLSASMGVVVGVIGLEICGVSITTKITKNLLIRKRRLTSFHYYRGFAVMPN